MSDNLGDIDFKEHGETGHQIWEYFASDNRGVWWSVSVKIIFKAE